MDIDNVRVQLMKIGGKNNSVAFIILFSVFTFSYIGKV